MREEIRNPHGDMLTLLVCLARATADIVTQQLIEKYPAEAKLKDIPAVKMGNRHETFSLMMADRDSIIRKAMMHDVPPEILRLAVSDESVVASRAAADQIDPMIYPIAQAIYTFTDGLATIGLLPLLGGEPVPWLKRVLLQEHDYALLEGVNYLQPLDTVRMIFTMQLEALQQRYGAIAEEQAA